MGERGKGFPKSGIFMVVIKFGIFMVVIKAWSQVQYASESLRETKFSELGKKRRRFLNFHRSPKCRTEGACEHRAVDARITILRHTK